MGFDPSYVAPLPARVEIDGSVWRKSLSRDRLGKRRFSVLLIKVQNDLTFTCRLGAGCRLATDNIILEEG